MVVRAAVAAAAIAALVTVVAAGVLVLRARSSGGEGLDEYFLRDVKTMQEMGLPVYWLGTEFTAGDLVFKGPYGAELGELPGGISMDYLASVTGGNTILQLAVYSRDAWERPSHHVKDPSMPGVIRKPVMVGRHKAELVSVPLGTRPVNTLWLVLDLGDVTILGTALAGGLVSPGGPDYSPFINNPDLLVQVMEDLRPYPE